LVSPKYGDLTGLGRIAVFYGTEEILYPDCREFCETAAEAGDGNDPGTGIPVTGIEYPGMQHDWVLLPMEEAKRAIAEACELIRGGDKAPMST
jgi:acetyl esterase/lipase